MAGLTVTEKEFWRQRIAARIARRIEAIKADQPAPFERIKRESHAQALGSLGLAGPYAELESIRAEELGSIPNEVSPIPGESTGEIDANELETYEEAE